MQQPQLHQWHCRPFLEYLGQPARRTGGLRQPFRAIPPLVHEPIDREAMFLLEIEHLDQYRRRDTQDRLSGHDG
ncbi:uncharacterized protein METZ01_LOCUS94958 [marine metagenome]|uniref:Uncharacterized protein n=1 Tax=marine metagenome TaxID=408172 RepID=A0A381VPF0_9ZZZZ